MENSRKNRFGIAILAMMAIGGFLSTCSPSIARENLTKEEQAMWEKTLPKNVRIGAWSIFQIIGMDHCAAMAIYDAKGNTSFTTGAGSVELSFTAYPPENQDYRYLLEINIYSDNPYFAGWLPNKGSVQLRSNSGEVWNFEADGQIVNASMTTTELKEVLSGELTLSRKNKTLRIPAGPRVMDALANCDSATKLANEKLDAYLKDHHPAAR